MTHSDPLHIGEQLRLPGRLKQHKIKSSALCKHCCAVIYGCTTHQCIVRREQKENIKIRRTSRIRRCAAKSEKPERLDHLVCERGTGVSNVSFPSICDNVSG